MPQPKLAEPSPSIFVVEDEGLIAMELSDRLTHLGYLVTGTAARGEDALRSICHREPDLVLMDIRLAGSMTGIETAARLRECSDVPVIYLTAFCDEELLRDAAETEPYGYLLKPFDEHGLHAAIRMALRKRHGKDRVTRTEAIYRAVIDLWQHPVAILSSEGAVLAANCTFTQSFGEAVAERVLEQAGLTESDNPSIKLDGPKTLKCELPGPDGKARCIEVCLKALDDEGGSLLCLCRDLENQGPAESSPSLGSANAEMLAVELSHHLNNLLSTIVGNAELARLQLSNGSDRHPADSNAANILDAASNAEVLVRRLLECAGRAPVAHQHNQLPELLEEALEEIKWLVPADCRLEREFEAECPPVLGDPEQVRRVIVELLANACQAVADDAGLIKVVLRRVDPGVSEPGGNPQNCQVLLSVSDNGCGMDDATRERIFEPFYSLRSGDRVFSASTVGQGVGLGLAVVRGIVHAHNGAVSVRSAPGEGSEFTISLPSAGEG